MVEKKNLQTEKGSKVIDTPDFHVPGPFQEWEAIGGIRASYNVERCIQLRSTCWETVRTPKKSQTENFKILENAEEENKENEIFVFKTKFFIFEIKKFSEKNRKILIKQKLVKTGEVVSSIFCQSIYEENSVLYARNTKFLDNRILEASFFLKSKSVFLAPLDQVGYYLDLKHCIYPYIHIQNGLSAEFTETTTPKARFIKIKNSKNEILLEMKIKKTLPSTFKLKEMKINLQKDFIAIKYGNGDLETIEFSKEKSKNKFKWDSSINPMAFVHRDEVEPEHRQETSDTSSTEGPSLKSCHGSENGEFQNLIKSEYLSYDQFHRLYYIDQQEIEKLVYQGDNNPTRLFRFKKLERRTEFLATFEDLEIGEFKIDLTKLFDTQGIKKQYRNIDTGASLSSYACINFSSSLEISVFYKGKISKKSFEGPLLNAEDVSKTRMELIKILKLQDSVRLCLWIKERYGYIVEMVDWYFSRLFEKFRTFKSKSQQKTFAKDQKKPRKKQRQQDTSEKKTPKQ